MKDEKTTIQVMKGTVKKLEDAKVYPRETLEEVILRLLKNRAVVKVPN